MLSLPNIINPGLFKAETQEGWFIISDLACIYKQLNHMNTLTDSMDTLMRFQTCFITLTCIKETNYLLFLDH